MKFWDSRRHRHRPNMSNIIFDKIQKWDHMHIGEEGRAPLKEGGDWLMD